MAVPDQDYFDYINEYREFDIEQLYYLLYPYIKEDFMGRQDCESVHSQSNLQVLVGTDVGSINHLIYRGGHDTHCSQLETEYRQSSEDGLSRLADTQESGEF